MLVETQWPDPELYTDRSLFLFTLRTPIRRFCVATIESTSFQRFVLVLITGSTAILASNDPLDSTQGVLGLASQVFSVLFAVEAIIQIIARGFIIGHLTYLRSVSRHRNVAYRNSIPASLSCLSP
jgi:hypothetical protein